MEAISFLVGKQKNKILIGRSDKIDLPDFSLFNISAKVDTGAYTSAIHSAGIKVTGKKTKKLTFRIVDPHTELGSKEFSTTSFTQREIKNSFGQSEKRYIISTKLLIFGKVFDTEFSLSDRTNMKHPILLGRKFLGEGFIVDVSQYNLSYKEKKGKKN